MVIYLRRNGFVNIEDSRVDDAITLSLVGARSRITHWLIVTARCAYTPFTVAIICKEEIEELIKNGLVRVVCTQQLHLGE